MIYKTSLDHLDKVLKCQVNHIAYNNVQLGNQTNIAKTKLNIQIKPIFFDISYDQDTVTVTFRANPKPKTGQSP